MEHFSDQELLQDAINCSEECHALLESPPIPPLSEYCTDHLQRKLDVFCRQCEAELCSNCVLANCPSTHQYSRIETVIGEENQRLKETADRVMNLLEEAKEVISSVKKMRQRVRTRKDQNMEKTKKMFNILRKIIDEREEQVITDVTKEADEKDKALKVNELCVSFDATNSE